MDRSATPWRVLDDAANTEPGRVAGSSSAGGPPDGPAMVLPGVSWRVLGGLGLAAALGIGAFVLAASAPGGEIRLEGGAAWTASGSATGSAAESGRSPSAAVTLVIDVQGAV